MKLSIVISSYNGAKHIEEQLNSLRLQTRPADEVLICDDGSTDGTVKIVSDFINSYELQNWKLIVNESNKGWRKNFIDGISMSNGDLIFTCDQDDIWRHDKLEVMEKIMCEHSEINLLVTNYLEFYEDGKEKIGTRANNKELEKVKIKNNFLSVESPGCVYCFRRELFDLALPYWFDGYAHDELLWRVALFTDTLYFYHDDLIKWRKHYDSAFSKEARELKTKKNKEKWLEFNCKVMDTLVELMIHVCTATKKERKVLKRNRKCFELRKKFYKTGNIFTGLHLMAYWDCYPRYRQYPADWYLIFIKH